MADEKAVELPKGCDWPALRGKTGTDLADYTDLLRNRAKTPSITKKDRPLTRDLFAKCGKCYGADQSGSSVPPLIV